MSRRVPLIRRREIEGKRGAHDEVPADEREPEKSVDRQCRKVRRGKTESELEHQIAQSRAKSEGSRWSEYVCYAGKGGVLRVEGTCSAWKPNLRLRLVHTPYWRGQTYSGARD